MRASPTCRGSRGGSSRPPSAQELPEKNPGLQPEAPSHTPAQVTPEAGAGSRVSSPASSPRQETGPLRPTPLHSRPQLLCPPFPPWPNSGGGQPHRRIPGTQGAAGEAVLLGLAPTPLTSSEAGLPSHSSPLKVLSDLPGLPGPGVSTQRPLCTRRLAPRNQPEAGPGCLVRAGQGFGARAASCGKNHPAPRRARDGFLEPLTRQRHRAQQPEPEVAHGRVGARRWR